MPRKYTRKVKPVIEVGATTVVNAAPANTTITVNPSASTVVIPESADPLLKAFIEDGIVREVPPTPEPATNTNIQPPPAILKRNSDGLYEGLKYVCNDYGRIDWQKMFNPKYFFYPNGDKSKEPLLKVDGLKDLAEIRGIERKMVTIVPISENLVACKVNIRFIGNVDDKFGREWEATADASPMNIGGKTFGKFLTAMAETRAIGRCIKEALGIRLATYEEMTGEDVVEPSDNDKPISNELVAAITRQKEIKGLKPEELMVEIKKKLPLIDNVAQLTMEQGRILLSWLNDKPNTTS